MAAPAGVFIGLEDMEAAAVAGLAVRIEHENVFRMPVGFSQGNGALADFTEVALPALSPGFLPSVGL
jgi:hypothetical protein